MWCFQGLKPRQLAVLFRNNHFNTIFKIEDSLFILVTDQGYLHERVSHLHWDLFPGGWGGYYKIFNVKELCLDQRTHPLRKWLLLG
jgi:hypothetical protein